MGRVNKSSDDKNGKELKGLCLIPVLVVQIIQHKRPFEFLFQGWVWRNWKCVTVFRLNERRTIFKTDIFPESKANGMETAKVL